MDRKRQLINEYKQRKISGGVYRITNTANGKYLLGNGSNLAGLQNRFKFSVETGTCLYFKLRNDWKQHGPQAFTFEILEELEMKDDQSASRFGDDLKELQAIWQEKLGAGNTY
ncbi:MAG: GIY-YIG nuclease family protein [Candidatus Neomarinimicrobiota bacterium]